jgi:hypothetical protein
MFLDFRPEIQEFQTFYSQFLSISIAMPKTGAFIKDPETQHEEQKTTKIYKNYEILVNSNRLNS